MLHGLLDKGTFKQAKVLAFFVADDSVCDLIFSACIGCEVVKQRNMVSAQNRNRTADHHGYNTPFSISDYIPLRYGPLRKNRIKAEHRNMFSKDAVGNWPTQLSKCMAFPVTCVITLEHEDP